MLQLCVVDGSDNTSNENTAMNDVTVLYQRMKQMTRIIIMRS